MRMLYITRKYPPSVGGMENYNFELVRALDRRHAMTVIAWGGSQKLLPYFFVKALVQALWFVRRDKITRIHIGDSVLAPLGVLLRTITRFPVSVTVYGLDIMYPNRAYQWLVPRCVSRLDPVVCISEATREEAVRRGIPSERCIVIAPGVAPFEPHDADHGMELERLLSKPIGDRKMLLTVGRLVERKGVCWFLDAVLPELGASYVYVVAGDGPERSRAQRIVEERGLGERVQLLGQVSDRDLENLYLSSDVFVMPNVVVAGTMEGFGLVALEAASAGVPVVASDTEGIRDAVVDGETGLLVEPGNVSAFVDAIKRAEAMPRERVAAATSSFSWENVARRYDDALEPA
jgi:glycosyltransferase involved in cell wall biosynthesis